MATNRDWVEVNGVCLRYELSGSGPETIVLVHEMGGSIESWDDIVPALENEFRVLCYDQRGFGLSEKNTNLSIDAMVDDLAALLDALSLAEPVYLAGAALGAAISLAFTLRHPARVKGLVVSSPATGGMTASALAAMEARLELVKTGNLRAVTDAMFQITYPPATRTNREGFERHRKRWLTIDPEAFMALNRMMANFDLTARLPEIACPVLVLGCAYDTIRPPARSAELAASIPGAQYVEVTSGHYMPLQSPELFKNCIRNFVFPASGMA